MHLNHKTSWRGCFGHFVCTVVAGFSGIEIEFLAFSTPVQSCLSLGNENVCQVNFCSATDCTST